MHSLTPQLQTTIQAQGNNGRCVHPPLHHNTLRGLAAQGRWATTPAKAYPSHMCRAMATALVHTIATAWPHLQVDHDDHEAGTHDWSEHDLTDLYQPLDPYLQHEKDKERGYMAQA